MYKDHKAEGGYRPVVSGCNSDTLGLSNTLSEIIEAVCMAVEQPYEVVSSEDMLARVEKCNEEIEKIMSQKDENMYLEKLFKDGADSDIDFRGDTDEYNWESEYMMLGTDVKSLFPSLSATKTGESVRKQITKSPIKWNNINWDLVTLYVKCHENIWKHNELKEIYKYLPERKSRRGRPPSIGTDNLEKRYRWRFPTEYLTDSTKAKLMGFAMEAAIIFFFNNFVYTFGGRKYVQCGGGPIGARLTMAVARLVMQQWKEEYDKILENSKVEELMSGLYVDDGRSFTKLLSLGMRFVKNEKKFVFSENAYLEDLNRGRSRADLTREQILIAMNSINTDLEFTMETHLDFEDKRLPTLSFSLWPGQRCMHHSYFEKHMRNQVLVVERTAMGRQSIMSIMSNELMRRLQVIDDRLDIQETINVVENYVQQLVNSEYNWKQIREICVSALIGYKRQETLRKLKKRPKYRSGVQSLKSRIDKKISEKFNWYKRKNRKFEDANENVKEKGKMKMESINEKSRWKHYKRRKPRIAALENETRIKGEIEAKAVLFVQNTKDSVLANQIRDMIQKLKPWTGINLKVVERAGDKIQDLLHKSNPWEDQDCERKSCHTCISSTKSDESVFKSCTKRSIIYETWCETCLSSEKKKLRKSYDIFSEPLGIDKLYSNSGQIDTVRKRKVAELKQEEILKFRYIGETSRSAYERGVEHFKDLEFTRSTSHMLKHAVIHHPDLDPNRVEFRMKILSSHQSAFERQIREAVLIQKYSGVRLMNSKLEYNRCSIPRIIVKTGNKESPGDKVIEQEKLANDRIKNLFDKKNNKKRNTEGRTVGQAKKKRKLNLDLEIRTAEISDPSFLTPKHCSRELENINLHKNVTNPKSLETISITCQDGITEENTHELNSLNCPLLAAERYTEESNSLNCPLNPSESNSCIVEQRPETMDRPFNRSCYAVEHSAIVATDSLSTKEFALRKHRDECSKLPEAIRRPKDQTCCSINAEGNIDRYDHNSQLKVLQQKRFFEIASNRVIVEENLENKSCVESCNKEIDEVDESKMVSVHENELNREIQSIKMCNMTKERETKLFRESISDKEDTFYSITDETDIGDESGIMNSKSPDCTVESMLGTEISDLTCKRSNSVSTSPLGKDTECVLKVLNLSSPRMKSPLGKPSESELEVNSSNSSNKLPLRKNSKCESEVNSFNSQEKPPLGCYESVNISKIRSNSQHDDLKKKRSINLSGETGAKPKMKLNGLRNKFVNRPIPKSPNQRKVLRKDIRVKSPSKIKSPGNKLKIDSIKMKQRHLHSASENKSNMVSKLIQSFEKQSVECVKVSHNLCKNDDMSLNCIKKGLVRDAYDLLMTQKGDGTPTPIKTPRRRNIKRLDKKKIASDQKKISEWVRK